MPFRIDDTVRIIGDADAAAALAAILRARTGAAPIDDPAASNRDGRVIDLRIEGGGARESYRIAADEASVVVTGADAAGLFYGVQTLGQLVARDGDSFAIPAVKIADAPRFAYRGVMLDVARHFHPVETVKAYIDRAAGLKFNALHLHLSDDQGWRIQLDSRPKLTDLASATAVGGDAGGFYSKADYREIVAVRGIPSHDRRARDRPARSHARGRTRVSRTGRAARRCRSTSDADARRRAARRRASRTPASRSASRR